MESEKVKEIKKALEERTQHKPINCSHSEYVEACGMYCRHHREFVADMGIKNGQTCENCIDFTATDEVKECADILNLINELESDNKSLQDLCNKTYEDLTKEIDRLENRVKELEDGIAKSMLGCEFLPECTKEIAEKIWDMSKITVDATKHIVQGREYLHLDALKEIIKSLGVEIKE